MESLPDSTQGIYHHFYSLIFLNYDVTSSIAFDPATLVNFSAISGHS